MRLETHRKRRPDPDLTSLINIVFLILVFFIVAGSLRPFGAPDLELTKLARGAIAPHVDGRLLIHGDGRLVYRGAIVTVADLVAALGAEHAQRDNKRFDIIADRRAPAAQVLAVVTALKSAGFAEVAIVTQKSPD
jgi:biopolymer transport protein ExbD